VQADLTTYDGVETVYRAIQATGRPVEAIALNAGIGVGGSLKTRVQGAAAKVLPATANAAQHRALTEPGSGTE
jgi:short-subunit dehydrogenase